MDFPRGVIEINSISDQWGPFAFDFGAGLPEGDAIITPVVKSWLEGTETTTYLIEPNTTGLNGDTVSVRLQYPGATRIGKHLLTFDLTLASGAKHRYTFGYVSVT